MPSGFYHMEGEINADLPAGTTSDHGWLDDHHARLNSSDRFRYLLARETREPLLFKGDDFAQTDIEPALKD